MVKIKLPKYKNPNTLDQANQPKMYSPAGLKKHNLETYGKLTPVQRGEMAAAQVKRDPKGAKQLIEFMKHPKGYKKGGKVKKTGIYKLHKGERVLTKKQQKKLKKNKK